MSDSKDHLELAAELLEVEEGLSDWEVEFVESVHSQLEQGRELTERQIEKLEQIWQKIFK